MSPPSLPTAQRWLFCALRFALTALLIYAMIRVNSRYLFHTKLYEAADMGAYSLSVLRAGQFGELYGAYSRWEFHHPGPAMFYWEALGETVFHRWLHLTPTPYNAQVLAVIILLASLFAAGISIAARWVRSGVFLALAMAFAVLHFAAVDGRLSVLSTWPAHVIPLIFFCLLVTAASVGAGRGEDLPLLMLAGCFLIHLQVAQPLFVGPMFLLGYTGLWWSCHRRRGEPAATTPVSLAKEGEPVTAPAAVIPTTTSSLPWRVYRRSHRIAAVIAALFALPILLDLFLPDGNFQQILTHLRDYRGQHHPWLASLGYFLQFAAYKPSLPGSKGEFPDYFTGHETLLFVLHHPTMMLLWGGALLAPLLPLAARLWRGRDPVLLGGAPAPDRPVTFRAPVGRWRFLGWLWSAWVLSVGLTLYWGHIQDGPMFHFNAWFDYSIWYVLALLAAGAIADGWETVASRSDNPLVWKAPLILACAVVAGITLVRQAERFHANDYDRDDYREQAQTIAARLATEPAGTPPGKLLIFPHDAWETATGIAALLARRGDPVYVLPSWQFMFGSSHVMKDWTEFTKKPADTNPRVQIWHLVAQAPAAEANHPGFLLKHYALMPDGLPIDPTQDFAITWTGEKPNFDDYVGEGWDDPGSALSTMTKLPRAVIQFRPVPVPAGATVRMVFDLKPFLANGVREAQRMEIHLNGHDLGTLRVAAVDSAEQQVTISAALWNRYASGLLTLDFPDALSLHDVGQGADKRLFAFEIRRITFGVLESGHPAPAAPEKPVVSPAEGPRPEPTPAAVPATKPLPTPDTEAKANSSPVTMPEVQPETETSPTPIGPLPEPTPELGSNP